MWRRYHLDGSWSTWVKVIDETDLATVSTPGIVQLNNTTSSTSTTQAATANAVKIAYTKAVDAYTKAESAQGSSASADKLTTARTIGITGVVTGTATAFDGSKNISIDATKLNIEDTGITGELPIAHGGTGRTDGKAVGLVTKRTIDGVSFDGSANITHFSTCSTEAATAAKVVSVANFVLATGAEVTVQFTVTNTAASPTLNVNGTGAKAIVYRNAAISAGYLAANRVYKFVYDGTNYELIGDVNTDTKYSAATTSKAGIVQLNNTTSSTSTTQAATANAVKTAYDKAVEAASNKSGLPLGHIYLWPFSTPPDGSIQLNGSEYNRELYSDLWALVQEKNWYKSESEWQSIASANGGYCPWYSDGDGGTTFRTPKFAPYQKLALASSDAGKYYEAGLPDHDHTIITYGDMVDGGGQWAQRWTNTRASKTGMASASNGIYGRSTTVQPESHDWIVCVVAFGTATNVGSIDVANVISAVSQVQAEVTDAKEIDSSGYTSSQHWVRYTDGRQIIYSDWGSDFANTSTRTFVKPFTTNPALIGFDNETHPSTSEWTPKFSEITGTYFKINDWACGSVTKTGCWVAMGTWK